MKVKNFELISMYLPIIVVCILLGTQVRTYFIDKGSDEFTANIFFIVVIFVGVVIYSGLTLFLHTIYEIISRIITKRKNLVLVNEFFSGPVTIADIKEDLKFKEVVKFDNKLEIALRYTKEQFALYTSVNDLENLCSYITKYAKKEKIENFSPVRVHKLSNMDLYHFGWNIWKHFDRRNQYEVALFLKEVFQHSLKDVETDSIKSHLKDDDEKGIIKIKRDLKF